jgi:integrase
MSIYRRGETWWYTFMVKGKVHRGSCKTTDEAQAREYHDRTKADAWRGRVMRDAQKHTVEEAIKRFLKERENKRSYRDDQRYADWWREELKSAQVVMLEDVVPDVVAEIRNEALTRKTPRGNLTKPATMNRRLAFLRSVLYTAHKEWMWLEQCPKIKLLTGEAERRRFLQPEEVIRLVEALPEPYGDMALFAVSTGLRQGNVIALRWEWVNMQKRCATFPHEVMKNGLPFSCALNETAITVLRRYLGKDTERVFVKPDGQPVSSIPSKTWAQALKKAGLKDVRWHDLRHTWASLLRQSGVELSELQELGGWESATMVQRYAHLNVEHLVTHAQKMDGLLAPKATTAQNLHRVA